MCENIFRDTISRQIFKTDQWTPFKSFSKVQKAPTCILNIYLQVIIVNTGLYTIAGTLQEKCIWVWHLDLFYCTYLIQEVSALSWILSSVLWLFWVLDQSYEGWVHRKAQEQASWSGKTRRRDQLPQPGLWLKMGLPSETPVCAAVGRSVAPCVSVCEWVNAFEYLPVPGVQTQWPAVSLHRPAPILLSLCPGPVATCVRPAHPGFSCTFCPTLTRLFIYESSFLLPSTRLFNLFLG